MKTYKDKFNMSNYENMTFARPKIVEMIHLSSRLEGLAVTFAETEQIYNNRTVKNMSIFDLNVIVNIKRSYQYILEKDTLKYPSDFSTLLQINKLLGKVRGDDDLWLHPGELRIEQVKITGSKWIPGKPNGFAVREDINDLLEDNSKSETEKGLDLFLYVCKNQIFNDGNKRTATLIANHHLIQKGKGLLLIPEDKITDFKEKLIKYYDTNETIEIKDFLYDHCLEGMENKKISNRITDIEIK